ncbi:MAG: TlpA family protein disulfide reductase [Candidatus Hermodarchaeia archaeon]|jgi:cytochrome c biogenesis protein CcmG/thiol:disulfide interchange protein DsbE
MIDTEELMNDPELADFEQNSPRIEWGKIAIFGSVLGLLGILGWGLIRVQAGPRSSGNAPDFTLYTFDGEKITLSELRGKVVIINFWASWCPPCKEEAPYLEEMWRKYKDQGVVFLGVDYVDTEPEALAYIEEFDITYPNGPDLRTEISQAYRIKGVPETFFVAKDSTLKGVKIGPLTPPELENRIEELLAEAYE